MVNLPNFGRGGKKQGQTQTQLQFNLQICDDTWERLLCALERLEYVTEYKNNYEIPRAVATRLDRHKDKGNIQESQIEVELEVQGQIQAFKYIVKTVQNKTETWLLQDFISWLAGRERKNIKPDPLPLSIVDDYAIPVLQCILGESFNLPKIPPVTVNQKDVEGLIPDIGSAQIETDKIQKRFQDDPTLEATRHQHDRGAFQDGMERLQAIAKKLNQSAWFNRFISEKRWQTR
jgi:hypothetical protein